MQEKIKLYEEMLALEPGSKFFFPLAKMLMARKEYERARKVINQGLSVHPEFMEARLLLLDVLGLLGEDDTAQEETASIVQLLSRYQGFWKSWEALLGAKGDRDGLVAMRVFRGAMQGTPLRWVDILEQGCDQMLNVPAPAGESGLEDQVSDEDVSGEEAERDMAGGDLQDALQEMPPVAVAAEFVSESESMSRAESATSDFELSGQLPTDRESTIPMTQDEQKEAITRSSALSGILETPGGGDEPDSDLDADEVETISIDPDVRTRTMADLLMEQEEYGQALDIYEGLWEIYPPGPERQGLEKLMETARKKLAGDMNSMRTEEKTEQPQDEDSEKDEIVKTLSALADRLEERART
jgi:tetratricopeptide (TPR) repeat protein